MVMLTEQTGPVVQSLNDAAKCVTERKAFSLPLKNYMGVACCLDFDKEPNYHRAGVPYPVHQMLALLDARTTSWGSTSVNQVIDVGPTVMRRVSAAGSWSNYLALRMQGAFHEET